MFTGQNEGPSRACSRSGQNPWAQRLPREDSEGRQRRSKSTKGTRKGDPRKGFEGASQTAVFQADMYVLKGDFMEKIKKLSAHISELCEHAR